MRPLHLDRWAIHCRRLRRMRARVLRGANYLSIDSLGEIPRAYTLTFRERGCKNHGPRISELLRRLRAIYRRGTIYGTANLRYTWIGELQRDGTPHYHVIIWGLPALHFDRQRTHRGHLLWPWGMSSYDGVAENGAAYACSYASKFQTDSDKSDKFCQKRDAFPRNMRISGAGGLKPYEREDIRIASLPKWASDLGVVRRVYVRGEGSHWYTAKKTEVFSPFIWTNTEGRYILNDVRITCPLFWDSLQMGIAVRERYLEGVRNG